MRNHPTPEEEIHTVIALGYPDEVYQRVAERKRRILIITPSSFCAPEGL